MDLIRVPLSRTKAAGWAQPVQYIRMEIVVSPWRTPTEPFTRVSIDPSPFTQESSPVLLGAHGLCLQLQMTLSYPLSHIIVVPAFEGCFHQHLQTQPFIRRMRFTCISILAGVWFDFVAVLPLLFTSSSSFFLTCQKKREKKEEFKHILQLNHFFFFFHVGWFPLG